MPVSTSSSRAIYEALKGGGIRLMSALPETWLVHLIRMAEEDPDMTLVRLAKEEEGVGMSPNRSTQRSSSTSKLCLRHICSRGLPEKESPT